MPYTPPNYAATTAGGTRRRVFRVQAENVLNGAPWCKFHEHDVAKLADGSEVEVGRGDDLLVQYDPDAVVPIIDPTTEQPTGATMTHGEILAALHSLGRKAQTDRDDAEAARIAAIEAAEGGGE